jgi:hypothetical protein
VSANALEKELATYEFHKGELLGAHDGKSVVIQGDVVAGVWDTYKDALEAGYGQFGLTPFLVRQIHAVERVQFFTRDIAPCQS